MRNVMAAIRSTLFYTIFYPGSLLFVLAAIAALPFRSAILRIIAGGWGRFHRICARLILGQRVVIEGPVPAHPQLCVMKHESMFETIDLLCLFHRPVVAAKRELLNVPLWGFAARKYGLLPIDRSAGAGALRTLRRVAVAAIAEGRPICLFPEGTRVPPGERPPLKSGFAGLYILLKVPAVPVAVDSGHIITRGRYLRYPGIIRYRFGEPIPPGLPRAEAEAAIHSAINALND